MKRLESFEKEKAILTNIWGGKEVATAQKKEVIDCCTYVSSDSFDDKDGDGVWDSNESGRWCIMSTTCE